MIGVVVISHGGMCKGMLSTAEMLLGTKSPQLEAVELELTDSPDKYIEKLEEAIVRVDTGDGVLLLADLFGGTPNNQAVTLINERVKLISGVNFPLLLDLLCSREFKGGIEDYDLNELVEIGKDGMKNVSGLLGK